MSIQLIGMLLFFYIKELGDNLWNKNPEIGHFFNQKWPLMAKIPNFFILIQYDYALWVSS